MEHPFSCLVAGPSKAGKTMFVKKLIDSKNYMIKQDLYKIWWFYSESQPLYDTLSTDVEFVQGLPDSTMLQSCNGKPQLVILDDLMQETKNNALLTRLFTRGCHHWNISIIQIVQNAFFEGLRTSRINSDYLVLFKNPADRSYVGVLARQLFPKNTKYFLQSYEDATIHPHGYLFVDLTQYTPDNYRLKTDIFSNTPTLYVPENYKYQ
jgi:GTPase SAR1 family protein